MKILCVGWKLTKEEEKTMEAIVQFIKGNISEKDTAEWVDCHRYDLVDYDDAIVFGKKAQIECGGENLISFLMPSFDRLKKDRQESFSKLKDILKEINEIEEKRLANVHNAHIELQDGTTVGKEACDINITEKEAEYLKTLKGMLSGSKMVILKGDLRVEVE